MRRQFGPHRMNTLVALLALVASPRVTRAQHPPGYGPNPALPPPDTTSWTSRFIRGVGWPASVTPKAAPGFTVALYADRLRNPRWLHVLPNGDVLVAESANPGAASDSALSRDVLGELWGSGLRGISANRITLLRDTTRDGVPDVRSAFLEGLHQPFGIALLGRWLYVANTDALMRYPYEPGQLKISAPGEKVLDLPAGGYNNHWTRNVLPSRDGRKLYVSVGSATNVDVQGIDVKDPRRAAILELNPDGTGMRVFASGMRNPIGLAWEPATGALWAAVNERDGTGEDLVPDYITRVREGAFYGWPYAYFGAHEDPRHAGRRPDLVARAVAPDFAMGAHTTTMAVVFYQGSSFPARYRGGVFVTQRGSWNRREFAGYRVAFLPFHNGRPAGLVEDFVTGFLVPDREAAYGRPVGLAVLQDGSLLVADDAGDRIWRVTAIP